MDFWWQNMSNLVGEGKYSKLFSISLSQYVVSKSYQNDNFLVDFSFEMRHIWGICFQLDIFSLRNLKQKKEEEKTGHQELIICYYDIIHFVVARWFRKRKLKWTKIVRLIHHLAHKYLKKEAFLLRIYLFFTTEPNFFSNY